MNDKETDTLKKELQALREIVEAVVQDYWVHGEVYERCFFCNASFDDGPEDHKDDCLAMRARAVLKEA